jgi:hypothetical protein
MTARFKDVCIDANDHQMIADWWCSGMGYRRTDDERERDWPVPIVDPAGAGPVIWVNVLADPAGNEFCVFAPTPPTTG